MILELIIIVSASVNISVGCLIFFFHFFKLKYIFQNIKMNAEDLLKDIPLDTPDEQHDLQQESKRERISAIIAGGGSRQYWKQLKQPGVKRECKDWILLMSKCKKNITQSRLLMM